MTDTSGQSLRLGTGAAGTDSSRGTGRRPWRTARLLYSTHLSFVVVVWLVFAAVVAVVTVLIDMFGDLNTSVWDHAASGWLMLVYSTYFISKVLPVHVANGQTRREYLIQAAAFVAGAVGVVSALMTLGYVVERVAYQAADLPQEIVKHRLFDSGYEILPIFLTFVGTFSVWVVVGAFCAAGFYRSNELGVLTLVPAFVLIGTVGVAVGDDGLPFAGQVHVAGPPIVLAMAICAAATAAGAALTWAIARDMPLKTGKS